MVQPITGRLSGTIMRAVTVLIAVSSVMAIPTSGGTDAQTAAYTITDLGTLGGIRSAALSVNDDGDVAGYSMTGGGATRGFVYAAGSMRAIGTFGGRDSMAYGISNLGTVAGRAQDALGAFRAFVMLPGGKLIDLTQLSSLLAGPFSTSTGVSPAGLLVGYRLTPGDHMSGRSRIFLFSDSVVSDLGTFGGQDAVAAAINDVGQFTGFFSTEAHADYSDRRAFLARLGGQATDLGTLGGRITTPTAINASGQVTGFGQTPNGDHHAFLYTGGKLVDLGVLAGGRESFGYGLNDRGQVVGASESGTQSLRAFLHDGTQMIDLNTLIPAASGWVLTEARDINSAGAIVGTGVFRQQQRAFLLTRLQ